LDYDDEAPELTLRLESFKDCWAEGAELVRAEVKEVEPNGRQFNPDVQSILTNEALGIFKILVARKNGEMIGYLTWMIDFDLEAYGTLIANQTAWYLKPGHYGVADKMFDFAMAHFKQVGVKYVYWHHTFNGRGKTLGRYFQRKGAKPISMNYMIQP